MKLAQQRDAAKNGKFWFRRNITLPHNVVNHFSRSKPSCSVTKNLCQQLWNRKKIVCDSSSSAFSVNDPADCVCDQLSVDEIINGSSQFPGLIPLLNLYLESMEIDAETMCNLSQYLRIVSKRASGEVPTPANIIRNYVTSHQDYHQDSVINDSVCFDLLKTLNKLQHNQITFAQLLEQIDQMKRINKSK